MDNFLELEKKCKTLRKKQFLKYGAVGGGAFFVLIASLLLFKSPKTNENNKKHTNNHKTEKNITKKIEHNKQKVEQIKKIEKVEKKSTPKTIKKEKSKQKTIVPPMLEVEFDLNKIGNNNLKQTKTKKSHTSQQKKQHTKSKTQQKKETHKNIISSETITFNKALYLAKNAFNKHNYQESIKWCKIASNLNNDSAEVWRLYALNLVRLNQKDKAIVVLETYLKYKKSIKIKHLLQRLKK